MKFIVGKHGKHIPMQVYKVISVFMILQFARDMNFVLPSLIWKNLEELFRLM